MCVSAFLNRVLGAPISRHQLPHHIAVHVTVSIHLPQTLLFSVHGCIVITAQDKTAPTLSLNTIAPSNICTPSLASQFCSHQVLRSDTASPTTRDPHWSMSLQTANVIVLHLFGQRWAPQMLDSSLFK